MRYLKKIIDVLTPEERKRSALLLLMILVMAFLDALGVASILPFMAVLANPKLVESNQFLNTIYIKLGFADVQSYLFALGILVFAILVFSLIFKALTIFVQLRFTLLREYSIGKRLVEGYLHQPYSWFLSRHSSDLGKTILSEVSTVIHNCIVPTITLISQGAVAVALLTLMVLISPKLAVTVCLTVAIAYVVIFKSTRSFLARIGRERIKANQARYAAVGDAFGASKEIKVGRLEGVYIQRFSNSAYIFAQNLAAAQAIGQMPRFALEALGFGGVMLVTLYLMAQHGSFASIIPTITLYAFAGYRLMPALQQIYAAATQLRFSGPALDALHADLMSLRPAVMITDHKKIQFEEAIALNNVHYRYPKSSHPILKNLTLKIPAKSTVGFVGTSGSGKTTIVDLIIGLLDPQRGTLEIDGHVISECNQRAWQQCVGYVPQQIYLSDDTIAANIAFGVDAKDINQEAVEQAAKIANLHDFVFEELPEKYQTTVGERGVRLSGGQRQRIGIARALYHNPKVLILDEATSSLDNLTEKAVMEAVTNLGHKITIIMIAHRLNTVKACDIIFFFEKGELKAQGTYEELINNNKNFRALTKS